MKLLALRCGDLRTDIGGLVGNERTNVIDDVPVMTFAVDTGDGVLVFDTGLHEACCGPGGAAHLGSMAKLFEVRCPREALVDQRLAQAGYGVEDVRWVTNSHLHFDHAGRNAAFPAATHLVRARELEIARERALGRSGFLAGDLAEIEGSAWDYDDTFTITADGALSLISIPGHTAGHQALLVSFTDGRRFACTGDAAYTLPAILDGTVTGHPWDHDTSVASLARLRTLADDGVVLLTAHDLDQWRHLDDVEIVHSA